MKDSQLYQEKDEPPSHTFVFNTSRKISEISLLSTTLKTNPDILSQKRNRQFSLKAKKIRIMIL